MSGIGGIYRLDGGTIDQKMLNALAGALKPRGPDGTGIMHEGHIGLVHGHFWVTPEEVGEDQPLGKDHFWLTADARIDNRSELLPVLKDRIGPEIPSDAEIIIASYQEWGERCPRHLIGDFAFAIWDGHNQRLFCARDPVGIKPLHYAVIDETFVCGSDVGSILSTLDTLPRVHIPFLTDLLAGRYERWIHETAFQDVFRIPPAHYLVADSHGIVLERYWTFGANPKFQFRTAEEYTACFRKIFRESVLSRTRAISPIGLTVSGGLDSSSIACMVNHLKSSGEIGEPCRIYSLVYDQIGSADERTYLDTVLSACPSIPATRIPGDGFWGLHEFAGDRGFPLDDPETEVIRSGILALLRRAHEDRCRVVLSGYGGDQVMLTDAYMTPYTLKDVGIPRLPDELPHFRRFTPSHWNLFMYSYITPFLPPVVKSHIRRIIRKSGDDGFLTPLCTADTSSHDFLPAPRLNSRSSRLIYSAVNNGLNAVYRATLDTYASYIGIDWRYPFYDRRIIEFMLSVPPYHSFRKGYSRCILRKSMAGMVPEPVRMRMTKAHAGDVQDRGMREEEIGRVGLLLNNSHAVRMGLVNPAKLMRAWEMFRNAEDVPARPLVRYLCVEAWLRHHEKTVGDRTLS